MNSSAVFDSHIGELQVHKFEHAIPTVKIYYPKNVTGGDREVIAAELFEQDRWGRTVTLEKRDLSHHRQQPDEELSVDNYMNRSVLSSTFPYKGVKVITASRVVETPSGALDSDRGLQGRRRRYEGCAFSIHP